MSARSITYALMALLLSAGFGLGLLFATLSSEERRAASQDTGLAQEVVNEGRAAPSRTSSEDAAISRASSSTREQAQAREASATTATKASESANVRKYVVRGQVRRLDGEPLPGVTVRASPNAWRGFARQPSEMDPAVARGAAPEEEPDLGIYQAMQADSKARRREVLSDAAGQYEIALEGEDPVHVQAYLEGFEVHLLGDEPMRFVTGSAVLDFLAHPLSELEIDVRMPDGSQPAQAFVHARGGTWMQKTLPWSPSSKRAWLAEGSWELSASVDPEQLAESSWEKVEIGENAERREPVTLKIELRARLEGRIAWPQAELLGAGALQVAPVTDAEEDSFPQHNWRQFSGDGNVVEDAAGLRYRIEGLAWGKTELRVTFGNHVLLERAIEIGAAVTTCDLQVPALEDLRTASCRVLDPEGRPALDASLTLDSDPPAAAESRQAIVLRRGADRWVLAHHAPPGASEHRELVVEAMSPRWGTKSVRYEPRTTEALEIRFEPPASLELALTAAQATKVSAALQPVAALPQSSNNWSFLRQQAQNVARTLEAPGRTAWSKLQPGTYKLVVARASTSFRGFDEDTTLVEREVEIRSGKNEITADLPITYTVRFVVPEFAKWPTGLMVQGKTDAGEDVQRHEFAEADGTKMHGLAAGKYEVMLWSEDEQRSASFRLPGTSEVVLAPPQRPATQSLGFSVQSIEPGSRASRSGLRSGDVIVGVGGKPFPDEQSRWSMWHAVAQFQSAPKIAVTVERGGERLELELERELFADAGSEGLKVLPHPR